LAEHQEQIEAFYLPSYSPELNPDERLNADLNYALGSRVQVRTKDKLRASTENHFTCWRPTRQDAVVTESCRTFRIHGSNMQPEFQCFVAG
jgi:hypothetical protein